MTDYFPGPKRFSEAAAVSRLVPVCREVVADLDTPLTLFAKVQEKHEHIFLFESMEGGEKWGRYSFIGYDPLITFESKSTQVKIADFRSNKVEQLASDENPIDAIKNMVQNLAAAEFDELPPFSGGAVGFMGYEMVRFMEELPDSRPELELPDASLIVPRIVLAHDSLRQVVTVICWVPIAEGDDPELLYNNGASQVDEVLSLLKQPVASDFATMAEAGSEKRHEFTSNLSREEFHNMVEKAKEYIRSGDIIQVVLSQRFHTETDIHPLVLYRALRHINPSPYLFYLILIYWH